MITIFALRLCFCSGNDKRTTVVWHSYDSFSEIARVVRWSQGRFSGFFSGILRLFAIRKTVDGQYCEPLTEAFQGAAVLSCFAPL